MWGSHRNQRRCATHGTHGRMQQTPLVTRVPRRRTTAGGTVSLPIVQTARSGKERCPNVASVCPSATIAGARERV
eukprot:2714252-Prymnesium_polylepis.1